MRLEEKQGKSTTVKWQSRKLQFKSNKLKEERTERAQFYNIAQSHRWMTVCQQVCLRKVGEFDRDSVSQLNNCTADLEQHPCWVSDQGSTKVMVKLHRGGYYAICEAAQTVIWI